MTSYYTKIRSLILVGVFGIFCISCNPQKLEQTTEIFPITPSDRPTITFTPLEHLSVTSTTNDCLPKKTLVSSNPNSYIVSWSTDGKTLFFTETKENGRDQAQAYNVDSHSYFPPDLILPTPNVLRSYLNGLVAKGEIGENEYSISPTGNKALYIKKIFLSPTATINPVGGESDWPNYINEVYFVGLDLKPLKIGKIRGSIVNFVWFPNEQSVVIKLGIPDLGTFPTWVVDIANKGIAPFKEEKKGAYFWDISPDENWILYKLDKNTWVFDRKNKTDILISNELYISRLLWWSGDSSKFMAVRINMSPPEDIILYNLVTRKETTIPSDDFMVNTDAKVPALLSPDHSQMAFQEYKTNQIYILNLCLSETFFP